MIAEMVAGLESLGEPGRLLLEVDPRLGRVRRVPRPVQRDQLVAVGERTLCRPGGLSVADAAVNEDKSSHPGDPNRLNG